MVTDNENAIGALKEMVEDLQLLYGDVLNKLADIRYQARACDVQQIEKEVMYYTEGWVSRFADDDLESTQLGSVGSLLSAIEAATEDRDQ